MAPTATAVKERLTGSGAERRTHERFDVKLNARVFKRDVFQNIVVRNVSQGGLMIEGGFGLFVGDDVDVVTPNGSSYRGRVTWSVSPYCGVAFEQQVAMTDPLFASVQA